MIKKEIKKIIKEYRQQMVNTLCELVAIPTSNPPGSYYKQCVDYLSSILKEIKIDYDMIQIPHRDYPRFSLLGAYGKGKNSIHFHGHYDVVPADSPSQFRPHLREDCLHGRDSSDMKGGLVAMLFALRVIKDCGIKLKGRITFSLVPDEETGGRLGTTYLFDSGLLPLDGCLGMLMPEPTSGVIWNANKGALTYRIEIKGKSAHVGLEHQGVNAFEQMVRIASSLMKLKKEIQKRRTPMSINPPQANRSVMLIGGESRSGVSFNVVPDKAYFTVDRRLNPEEKLDEAKKELEDILESYREKGVNIETQILQEGEPSAVRSDTPLAVALRESIEDVTGKAPAFELCPGLCEIRFFYKRGIPAYAYGPGLLEVSHGPQEYVKINHILDGTAVYALTALRLLGQEK
ncbi:MAG: M20 family metallopeptidase [Candidatus Aminicenantales bacterium]